MGFLGNILMKMKDEDELREMESEMSSRLEEMDYDSDE